MVDHRDITRPEPRLQKWGTAHPCMRVSAHGYILFEVCFSLLENRSSLSFLPIHMILCRNRYSINPDCKCLSFCFLLICFHSSCQYSWLLFKFWTEVLSISKEDMPLFWVVQGASSTLTWVSSALHYWRLKEVCHPAGAVWYNACVVPDTFHSKWWKEWCGCSLFFRIKSLH